ncbi:hypothetical protein BJ508DRAFT_90298 [Ascobolus immersus RN42]|uniref:Uncharacterized protein n=1 Tax=Ascobolus immersus RN42 TaxID=1160509 RepID=A0A3N4IKX6_ASCIM|nr:hypothetical protein BJ508DRAFT_90298 [Ascobolus immersus RN42]
MPFLLAVYTIVAVGFTLVGLALLLCCSLFLSPPLFSSFEFNWRRDIFDLLWRAISYFEFFESFLPHFYISLLVVNLSRPITKALLFLSSLFCTYSWFIVCFLRGSSGRRTSVYWVSCILLHSRITSFIPFLYATSSLFSLYETLFLLLLYSY